jgi:hypothetical protein
MSRASFALTETIGDTEIEEFREIYKKNMIKEIGIPTGDDSFTIHKFLGDMFSFNHNFGKFPLQKRLREKITEMKYFPLNAKEFQYVIDNPLASPFLTWPNDSIPTKKISIRPVPALCSVKQPLQFGIFAESDFSVNEPITYYGGCLADTSEYFDKGPKDTLKKTHARNVGDKRVLDGLPFVQFMLNFVPSNQQELDYLLQLPSKVWGFHGYTQSKNPHQPMPLFFEWLSKTGVGFLVNDCGPGGEANIRYEQLVNKKLSGRDATCKIVTLTATRKILAGEQLLGHYHTPTESAHFIKLSVSSEPASLGTDVPASALGNDGQAAAGEDVPAGALGGGEQTSKDSQEAEELRQRLERTQKEAQERAAALFDEVMMRTTAAESTNNTAQSSVAAKEGDASAAAAQSSVAAKEGDAAAAAAAPTVASTIVQVTAKAEKEILLPHTTLPVLAIKLRLNII